MVNQTLQEELDTFIKNVSIYPARRDAGGNPVKLGIAFYYLDRDGKKMRKVLTGNPGEDMMKKREAFLAALHQEKEKGNTSPAACQIPLCTPQKVMISSPSYELPVQPVFPVCGILVRDAVDRQLKEYRPTVSHQTYCGVVSQANHVKRLLGGKRVGEIMNSDFQYLVNTLSVKADGSPAAPKSIEGTKIYFRSFIRFCWKQKWISADDRDRIIADVKTPTIVSGSNHEQEVKESKYKTYEELGNILHVLSGNRKYYYVVRIFLLTGLRPQEFFALKKDDLYPQEGYIHIWQAQINVEKTLESDRTVKIGFTKNKQSMRKVPAVPAVFEYLKELEKIQTEDGSRQRALRNCMDSLVIVDRNGKMASLRYFGRNMKNYQIQHGITSPFLLDMGRHCYQDNLDGLGAKDEDVERAVGHTLANVANRHYKTCDHYLRRLPPFIEDMNRLIEQEFQKAGGFL